MKAIARLAILMCIASSSTLVGAATVVGDFSLLDNQGDFHKMSYYDNHKAIALLVQTSDSVAVEQQDACTAAFFNIFQLPGAQERGFNNIVSRAVDAWVTAAEAALEKNESTFAVLSIDDIFWVDGSVAKLRAKGYVVEEP